MTSSLKSDDTEHLKAFRLSEKLGDKYKFCSVYSIYLQINPCKGIAIGQACKVIKNPFTTLEEIFDCVGKLLSKIKTLKADPKIYGKLKTLNRKIT